MNNPKADYVRREASRNKTFDHHCHWNGCDKAVPPAMWGCRQHWFTLPKPMRDAIWRCYAPGQEVTKTPSVEYLRVANKVQEWIAEYLKKDGEPSRVLAEFQRGAE